MSVSNIQQFPDIFSNPEYKVRDVELDLSLVLTKYPITERLVTGGMPSRSHKHEWFDDQIVQKTTTLTANIAAHAASATGLTITVADSSIFLVNDQVTVDKLSPRYRVTAIPTGTSLTVNEIAGVALASDAGNTFTAKYNRGQLELTTMGSGNGARFGDQFYNFTQIFRYDVQVSWHMLAHSQAGQIYPQGAPDVYNNAVQRGVEEIGWQMYEAVMNGIRTERAATSTPGMMGGVRQYVDITGGNVVANSSGAALSLALLNEATALIYEDMGNLDGIEIIAPLGLSRQFQGLDSNAIRYNDPQPTRSIGGNVASFIPEIGGTGGIPIIIDQNMQGNELLFINRNLLHLIPFLNFTLSEYRVPQIGATASQTFLYGEYTLVVRNGKQAHGIIKNIAVT